MEQLYLPADPSRKRARILGVLFLGFTAWVVYGAFTYSGVYRWLAELQMSAIGSYYPTITVLLPIVGFMMLTVFAARLHARFFGDGVLPPAIHQLHNHPATQASVARWENAKRWMYPAVIGVVLIGMSTRDRLAANEGRELERISAAELEQGKPAPGTWLEIEGAVLEDAMLSFKDGSTRRYMPVVSSAWQQDKPVAVVLRVGAIEQSVATTSPFRGAVYPDDLPGPIRAAYVDAGLHVENALILELGEQPASKAVYTRWLLPIGLFMLPIAFWQWRSWRRDFATRKA